TAKEGDGPASASPAIDDELVKLLGAAWKAASRDEEGYARLQEVGQIAGNRSSFDARNYGFKRLSDVIRTIGNFELRRRDNQLYVKRLRWISARPGPQGRRRPRHVDRRVSGGWSRRGPCLAQ